MPQPAARPPAWPQLVLKRADQAVAAAVIVLSLVFIGGYWAWQGHLQGRVVEIERAEPLLVEFKLDINQADWPELSLLPGIGETLAQRIVAYRVENGPFREWSDLRKVRGIGPLTLEGMKPYLLPIPGLGETAEEKSGLSTSRTLN